MGFNLTSKRLYLVYISEERKQSIRSREHSLTMNARKIKSYKRRDTVSTDPVEYLTPTKIEVAAPTKHVKQERRSGVKESKRQVRIKKNRDGRYSNIYPEIISIENLLLSYNKVSKSKGGNTVGTDKLTLDCIDIEYFKRLHIQLKSGKFKFNPVREVLIPKANSKEKRPLRLASPRDKIVQRAIQNVLEPILEETFLEFSHG